MGGAAVNRMPETNQEIKMEIHFINFHFDFFSVSRISFFRVFALQIVSQTQMHTAVKHVSRRCA